MRAHSSHQCWWWKAPAGADLSGVVLGQPCDAVAAAHGRLAVAVSRAHGVVQVALQPAGEIAQLARVAGREEAVEPDARQLARQRRRLVPQRVVGPSEPLPRVGQVAAVQGEHAVGRQQEAVQPRASAALGGGTRRVQELPSAGHAPPARRRQVGDLVQQGDRGPHRLTAPQGQP